MNKLLKIIALVLLFPLLCQAQGGRTNDVVFRNGVGIGGINVAVCQPVTTLSAAVAANIVTYTMSSNPQAAGFKAGMQIWVSGFTAGDTFFNAGTFTGTTITGGLTILAVTPTQIMAALVHANAAAGTNGTILQLGNTTTSCAGLSILYTDSTLGTISTNPLITDGYGNYGYWATPSIYYLQYYGPTVTTTLRVSLTPCAPTVSANCTSAPGGTPTQIQYDNAGAFAGINGSAVNNVTGAVTLTASADTVTALDLSEHSITQDTSTPTFRIHTLCNVTTCPPTLQMMNGVTGGGGPFWKATMLSNGIWATAVLGTFTDQMNIGQGGWAFISNRTPSHWAILTQGALTNSVDFQVDTGLMTNYGIKPVFGNGLASVQASPAGVVIGSGSSLGAAILCTTAQCPAGDYDVSAYLEVTSACGATGSYIVWLGWTDDAGAKAGTSTTTFIPMNGNGVTQATGALNLSSLANYAQGHHYIHTTGVATGGLGAINFGTTAVACGAGGPAVGTLFLEVTRLR